MITFKDAEDAVDFLRDQADRMGIERAQRLYLEQYLKSVKARVQLKQSGMSAAASEIVALASKEYLDVLDAFHAAVQADEVNRFKAAAAGARIEAWRTQESSRRSEGKAYS